jgi:microcystin-dependent protein
MAQEFVGAVKLFAGTFAISNYSFCDGTTIPISQNTPLFSLIGTFYGGNGTTTFQLPDLRGRVPIGQGQGIGLTNRNIGTPSGLEGVLLTTATTPPHQHALNASNVATTTAVAGPGVVTGRLQSTDGEFYTTTSQPGFTLANLNATAVSQMGGGQPHENRQPTLTITYLIALNGIFPSRN